MLDNENLNKQIEVLKYYDSLEESSLQHFKKQLDYIEKMAKQAEGVPSLAAYRKGKVEELKDQITLLSARRVELKKMIAILKKGELNNG